MEVEDEITSKYLKQFEDYDLFLTCKVYLKRLNLHELQREFITTQHTKFKVNKRVYENTNFNCKVLLNRFDIYKWFVNNRSLNKKRLVINLDNVKNIHKEKIKVLSLEEELKRFIIKHSKSNIYKNINFNCKVVLKGLDLCKWNVDNKKIINLDVSQNIYTKKRMVFKDRTNLNVLTHDFYKSKTRSGHIDPISVAPTKSMTNINCNKRMMPDTRSTSHINNTSPKKCLNNKDVTNVPIVKSSTRKVTSVKKNISKVSALTTRKSKISKNNERHCIIPIKDIQENGTMQCNETSTLKINNTSNEPVFNENPKGTNSTNIKGSKPQTKTYNSSHILPKGSIKDTLLKNSEDNKCLKRISKPTTRLLDYKSNLTRTLQSIKDNPKSSDIQKNNPESILSKTPSRTITSSNSVQKENANNEKSLLMDKDSITDIDIKKKSKKPIPKTDKKKEDLLENEHIDHEVQTRQLRNNVKGDAKKVSDIKNNKRKKKVCFTSQNTICNSVNKTPKKYLRGRKIQNYAEISLITNPKQVEKEKGDGKHIPIYKQILSPIHDHKPNDIYQFDFVQKNDSESDCEYDKDMKNIMKTIRETVNKPKKRVRKKKPPVQKPTRKCIEEINKNMINNILKKINNKSDLTNIESNVQKQCVVQPINNIEKLVTENKNNTSTYSTKKCTDVTEKLKLDSILECSMIKTPIINTEIAKEIPSDNLEEVDEMDNGFDNENYNIENEIDDDIHNDFGFESDNEIEVLSHHVIPNKNSSNANVSNISFSNFHRPGANSTMINNTITNKFSPWRPNIISRRGTLFLTTKTSNLPSYDQEMVINSTMNKSNNCTKSVINGIDKEQNEKEVTKSDRKKQNLSKQTSILNYVNAGFGVEETSPEQLNCSIFDEHGLSPIKYKENAIHPITPYKRRILGENQQNCLAQAVSTPIVKNRPEKLITPLEESDLESDGLENFFGFMTPTNKRHKKVVTNLNHKPNRINLGDIKKALRIRDIDTNKDTDNEVDINLCPNIVEVETEKAIETITVCTSQNNPKVALFEDLEVTFAETSTKSYKPKRRRRQQRDRSISEDEIEEEYPEPKPKKKKKEVWSREEKKQVDEWAAAFNSMCEDIDKYSLEVE